LPGAAGQPDASVGAARCSLAVLEADHNADNAEQQAGPDPAPLAPLERRDLVDAHRAVLADDGPIGSDLGNTQLSLGAPVGHQADAITRRQQRPGADLRGDLVTPVLREGGRNGEESMGAARGRKKLPAADHEDRRAGRRHP